MSWRFDSIPSRRAIIDRRTLADALFELAQAKGETSVRRQSATKLLKTALDDGRAEIARRLIANPGRGSEISASYAFLTDQLLRLIFDFTTRHLYPLNNRSEEHTSELPSLMRISYAFFC